VCYHSTVLNSTREISIDYGDLNSTHDAISAILEQRERISVNDKEIGARGNEAVGSVRQLVDKSGNAVLYRKQQTGRWELEGSRQDTWPLDEEDLTHDEKGDILQAMDKKPTTSTLIPNIDAYLDHNLNVLLVALHGVGKTVSLTERCRERGIKFKYYSCSTLDPFTDLVGVPTPRDYCPECQLYFKEQSKCEQCGGRTVEALKMVRPREVDEAELIFLDEFNRADAKTQNACFEIMQFKTINGEPLPKLKSVWAAINPPDDEQNYQVEPIDPAALDRFDLYIDITPKPSIGYMSKHMPQPIAAALKVFWDEHQNAIRNGTKQAHSDYISPRRLEKIGLVWCATQNTKSVVAALPMGGNFERRKLVDLLKQAQKEVNKQLGIDPIVEDEEDDLDGQGMGDRPAEQFTYKLASMRLDADAIAEYLTKYPMHYATHEKVVETLKQGVGGEELVLRFGKILNALNPSNLEGMVTSFPDAKTNEMRKGFMHIYENDKPQAKDLKELHKVLSQGANSTNGWPTKL